MLVNIYEGGLLYSDKVKREVERTNNNITNMAAYLLDRLGRPLVSTSSEWIANQPVRLIRHSTIYRFSKQSTLNCIAQEKNVNEFETNTK